MSARPHAAVVISVVALLVATAALILVIVKDGNPFADDDSKDTSRCEEARAASARFGAGADMVPEIKSGTLQELEANRKERVAADNAFRNRTNVILQFPDCFSAADVAVAHSAKDDLERSK